MKELNNSELQEAMMTLHKIIIERSNNNLSIYDLENNLKVLCEEQIRRSTTVLHGEETTHETD